MGHEVSQRECKQPAFLYGFISMEVLLSAKRWRVGGGVAVTRTPSGIVPNAFGLPLPRRRFWKEKKEKNDKNSD